MKGYGDYRWRQQMQNFKNKHKLILRETKKLYGRVKILSENNELIFFKVMTTKAIFREVELAIINCPITKTN